MTMTRADNRVQVADKPVLRRLLNQLNSGVNKYAPTAATTMSTKESRKEYAPNSRAISVKTARARFWVSVNSVFMGTGSPSAFVAVELNLNRSRCFSSASAQMRCATTSLLNRPAARRSLGSFCFQGLVLHLPEHVYVVGQAFGQRFL